MTAAETSDQTIAGTSRVDHSPTDLPASIAPSAEAGLGKLEPIEDYLRGRAPLPEGDSERWFLISRIRRAVEVGELPEVGPEVLNRFLLALPREHRFALFLGLVEGWGRLGVQRAMLESLWELVGR